MKILKNRSRSFAMTHLVFVRDLKKTVYSPVIVKPDLSRWTGVEYNNRGPKTAQRICKGCKIGGSKAKDWHICLLKNIYITFKKCDSNFLNVIFYYLYRMFIYTFWVDSGNGIFVKPTTLIALFTHLVCYFWLGACQLFSYLHSVAMVALLNGCACPEVA